jgi:hypothetical protein
MNMQGFEIPTTMKKTLKSPFVICFALSFIILTSCREDKSFLYEVNPVKVGQSGSDKNNVKTTIEFISIAYSDLFGTSITQQDLTKLSVAYNSFGDKKLIEDMIIRNFIKKPGIQMPTKVQMQNDIPAFVSNTYKRFYNREANEFELWYLKNEIEKDTSITPELIYYSFMTSNEYRYY